MTTTHNAPSDAALVAFDPDRISYLPPVDELTALYDYMAHHEFMHPMINPWGLIFEGVLSAEQCDRMIAAGSGEDGYDVPRCGAMTRQYEDQHSDALAPLTVVTHTANRVAWKYDIDEQPKAWLQSYDLGGDYERHMDWSPVQSRKLTAVAFLTDPADYDGGELVIEATPGVFEYTIPRDRGTVIVFQPWLIHYVTPVTRGSRQTVNAGFWGPAFR